MNTILFIKQLFAIFHCDMLTIKAQKCIVIKQMRNCILVILYVAGWVFFWNIECNHKVGVYIFYARLMEFPSISIVCFFLTSTRWLAGKKSERVQTTFVEYPRNANYYLQNRIHLDQIEQMRAYMWICLVVWVSMRLNA